MLDKVTLVKSHTRTYSFERAIHLSRVHVAFARVGHGGVVSVQEDGQLYHVLGIDPKTRMLDANTVIGRRELVELLNRGYGVSVKRPVWEPASNSTHPT